MYKLIQLLTFSNSAEHQYTGLLYLPVVVKESLFQDG